MKDHAARAGDELGHGRVLATGSENVFVNSEAFARAGDDYGKCGRKVAEGSATVLVNGKPAARVGSRLVCASPVYAGEPTVYVGGPSQLVLPITGGHGSKGKMAPKDAPGSADGGHPVDVASGVMWTTAVDFVLRGPMPFRWRRTYRSSEAGNDVGLGFGWCHDEQWSARRDGDQLVVSSPQGRRYDLPFPEQGRWQPLLFGRRITRDGTALVLDGAGDDHRRILQLQDDGTYRVGIIIQNHRAYANLTWEQGELVLIVDSAGRLARRRTRGRTRVWEALARDADGEIHCRELVHYEHDERGDLVRVREASGAEWSYVYDDDHRLLAEARPDGLTYHFRYEETSGAYRCIETWGDLPGRDIMAELGWASARQDCRGIHHTTFVYEHDKTTVTDAEGGVHVYDTNCFGMVTQYRDPEGYLQHYAYDGDAHMVAHTDRAGRCTRYDRDDAGRLLRIQAPGHHDTTFAYASDHVVVTQPGGRKWTMAYVDGLLTRRTDPTGATVTLDQDPRGLPLRASSGVRAEYDAAGDLTVLRDARGATVSVERDWFGRVRRITDRNGNTQRFEVDRAGRIVGVEDAMGHQKRIVRGVMGHAVATEAMDGATTTARYVGDVTVERVTSDGARWRMGYDALLRLRWIEAPSGEHHELDYDGIDRLVRETSFAGITERHEYDERGERVRTIRQDGSVMERSYDELGRLLRESVGDDTREFAYDACGALASVRTGSSLVQLERDAMGRVIRECQRVGDHRFEVVLERDHRGRVVARHYSSGWSVAMRRDAEGGIAELTVRDRRTTVTGLSFARDGEGREVAREATDGSVVETTRDARGFPGTIRVQSPELSPRVRHYIWDRRGLLTRVEDSHGGTRDYQLDELGRPQRSDGLGAQEGYSYSALGAPMRTGELCEVGRGGRPLRDRHSTCAWDALGRLAERRASNGQYWSYHYDGFGQLVRAERHDGTSKDYIYDGLGRRIAERCGDGLTVFGWDGDTAVEELGPMGRTRRVFADDGFTPQLEELHGEWRHVVTDAAGTPWLYLSPTDPAELELNSTGEVVREQGNIGPLRFAGQRHDDLVGLCYQRFRHYAPELGVFTSPDPLGLQGSLFDVGFVPNPTAYVDPLGLRSVVIVGGEFIAAAGDEGYFDHMAKYLGGVHDAPVYQLTDVLDGKVDLSSFDTAHLAMHGNNEGVMAYDEIAKVSQGPLVSGKDLGAGLHDAGLKPGTTIKSYACNFGDAGPNGTPSVAEAVAKETNANVIGPKMNPGLDPNTVQEITSGMVGQPIPEDYIGLDIVEKQSGTSYGRVGMIKPSCVGNDPTKLCLTDVYTTEAVGKYVYGGNAGRSITFGTNYSDVYIPLGSWSGTEALGPL